MGIRILNKIVAYLEKRIFILFFIFSIVVVLANLSSMSLITDIFSHFKLQYIYICFIFIVGFAILIPKNKSYVIGLVLSAFFIGLNLIDFLPSLTAREVPKTQNNIKLALFNVQTHNKNYDKVLLEIEQNSPDIILLQEVDDLWLFEIRSLKEKYPYSIEHERFDNFGVALYSKIPLKDAVIEYWTDYEVPVVKATILAKEKNIEIFKISAATGTGLKELFAYVSKILKELPKEEIEEAEEKKVYTLKDEEEGFTIKIEDGIYIVEGPALEKIMSRANLEDNESLYYFQKSIRFLGIEDALKAKGIKEGDTVKFIDWEMEWYD